MDLTLLNKKFEFPRYVQEKLKTSSLDFRERHVSIEQARGRGEKHLEAGVVVLLLFKNSEYHFQLIKRSDAVAQAGDISCPGGILEKTTDEMLHQILLKTGFIRTFDNQSIDHFSKRDDETAGLIRLFLMNGLREAWEEIGLSPLNVNFLGALPTYSLTYFSRTIFPLVCIVQENYDFKVSSEVDKVLEIPVGMFFNPESYAMLEIEQPSGAQVSRYNAKFPCLFIKNEDGSNDILWGATFNILNGFLKIIANDSLPTAPSTRMVKKVLSPNYISGNRH